MAVQDIKYVEKQDRWWTMLNTQLANWVIKRVNVLSKIQVQPQGAGKFEMGEEGAVLNLRTPVSASCNLGVSITSVLGVKKIIVQWGTIVGRQPLNFTAGLPAYLSIVGSEGYVYAKATYDLATLQWVSAEVIIDSNAFIENTSTLAYELIGSYATVEGELTAQSSCGNVYFSPCDLAD